MATRILRLSALAATLVAGSLALTGCTINLNAAPNGNGMMNGQGMMNDGDADSDPNTAFTANEIMFAQMMIPHHQQAVDMSDLALTRSKNSDVLALAAKIKAAQAPEIEQMQGWLDATGSHGSHNMNMGMDGMLTHSQMNELVAAQGTAFDKLYLTGMIAHHRGAIEMAKMVLGSDNDEAKLLGETITDSQKNEIIYMEHLLSKL